MTGTTLIQAGSHPELDTGLLIHPRPAPFTSGHEPLVRAGHGPWRTVVNGGAQYSKACDAAGHETEFRLGLTPRRPEMPTNEAPGRLTGYSCMLCFIDDLSDHGGRNGLDMTP